MFDTKIILDFSLSHYDRIAYMDKVMSEMNFVFLGQGRMRRTYLSPNKRYVIKFPYVIDGITGNRNEAYSYSQYRNDPDPTKGGAIYAPCRLIQNCILMMRAMVETFGVTNACIESRSKDLIPGERAAKQDWLPPWISYIDCEQVGRLPDGRIVAYDFT